jgi:mRNA interferase RelE/StbE
VRLSSDQPARRYEVRLARRAVRSLEDLQRRDQQRIRAAIDLLAVNPRPPSCVALQGEVGVYRVRVGDYRIVYEVLDYEVLDQVLVVQVVRVGHRREVYR